MIFLTVGTYPLPFDRLVRAVDTLTRQGLIGEEIFAQIGVGNYKPRNMEYIEMLEKDTFDFYLQRASCIVGHAGMGTITTALGYNKPLLVVPRIKRYKEHVNDHQVATARRFEKLGHVLVAYEAEELPEKIQQLWDFVPYERRTQARAVSERVAKFLNELPADRKIQG